MYPSPWMICSTPFPPPSGSVPYQNPPFDGFTLILIAKILFRYLFISGPLSQLAPPMIFMHQLSACFSFVVSTPA